MRANTLQRCGYYLEFTALTLNFCDYTGEIQEVFSVIPHKNRSVRKATAPVPPSKVADKHSSVGSSSSSSDDSQLPMPPVNKGKERLKRKPHKKHETKEVVAKGQAKQPPLATTNKPTPDAPTTTAVHSTFLPGPWAAIKPSLTSFPFVEFQNALYDWNHTNPFRLCTSKLPVEIHLPEPDPADNWLQRNLKIARRNKIINDAIAKNKISEADLLSEPAKQFDELMRLLTLVAKIHKNKASWDSVKNVIDNFTNHYRPGKEVEINGEKEIIYEDTLSGQPELIEKLRNKTHKNEKHITYYLPHESIYKLHDDMEKIAEPLRLDYLRYNLEHSCAELAVDFRRNYLTDAQGKNCDENGTLRPYLECGTIVSPNKLSLFNILSIFTYYLNGLVEYIHEAHDKFLKPEEPVDKPQPALKLR